MFFLKNAITRPYWKSMHGYVLGQMRKRESVEVAPKVWRLQIGKLQRIYYICDVGGWPISWLYLTQRTGWQAWEVAQIWTFPDHRGSGYAEALYKAAINHDRVMLASGKLHTQFSQSMWKSFIRRRLFNVWAHDFKHLDRTSPVWIEDDEVICNLPIYISANAHRALSDVRFIALRKDTR